MCALDTMLWLDAQYHDQDEDEIPQFKELYSLVLFILLCIQNY